jgi:hypothetical protein
MLFPQAEAHTDFTKTPKLVYGLPKVGKSTLASLMVDKEGRVPLFLATEEGHGSLLVSRAKVNSWEGFVKCVAFLEAEKARILAEHSCIVLDVVSDLDAWCSTSVAAKKNVEYVGDMDQGKGWKLLKDAFQQAMTKLMMIAPVCFIAHSQDKRLTWNGEQIVTQAPSLSKGALDWVNGKVEHIMYIAPANSKKEFPEITMQASSSHIAGSRQRAICKAYKYDPANPKAAWDAICHDYAVAQAALPKPVVAPVTAAATPA